MKKKLKITVVKRDFYKDLADEYAADKNIGVCEAVKDGQVYILEGLDKPEDFCSWAWADLQRDVVAIQFGANYPWIKQPNTVISCCTDGLRPVVFKLELIEE